MTIEAIRARHHKQTSTVVASSVFNALRSVWKAAGKHAERRRSERAMCEMDSRALRDTGIARGQIMSAAYKGSTG